MIDTTQMQFQLPLPTGFAIGRSVPLPLTHVRIYPGLFPSDDANEPLISITTVEKGPMIPTEDEFEARLYLQYFYGARQIVTQAVHHACKRGRLSRTEGLGSIVPSEFPEQAKGRDALYMEIAFFYETMAVFQSILHKNSRLANHIFEKLYAYWPLDEFAKELWGDAGFERGPSRYCLKCAQAWLYGNSPLNDDGYVLNLARAFMPPLADATLHANVPQDMQHLSLTPEFLGNIERVYWIMQNWSINAHEDLFLYTLYPTPHVLFLMLSCCMLKVDRIQRNMRKEIREFEYAGIFHLNTYMYKMAKVMEAVEEEQEAEEASEVEEFTDTLFHWLKVCRRKVFTTIVESHHYLRAREHFYQSQLHP
jgi:hypothetical protein